MKSLFNLQPLSVCPLKGLCKLYPFPYNLDLKSLMNQEFRLTVGLLKLPVRLENFQLLAFVIGRILENDTLHIPTDHNKNQQSNSNNKHCINKIRSPGHRIFFTFRKSFLHFLLTMIKGLLDLIYRAMRL